jgi:hypothetical protein
MPLGRYFAFAGSMLLALLFIADRYLPKDFHEVARGDADRSIIRIHSDHKWPDAVVIDTSVPSITPPEVIAATDIPANPLRGDAFAQLPRAHPLERSLSMAATPKAVPTLRHRVRMARAPMRRVASYQAAADRGMFSPGW